MRVLQTETHWDTDDFNDFLAGIPEEMIREIRIIPNPGRDSDTYPLGYVAVYYKEID